MDRMDLSCSYWIVMDRKNGFTVYLLHGGGLDAALFLVGCVDRLWT